MTARGAHAGVLSVLLASAAAAGGATPAPGPVEAGAPPVSFERDVRPILAERCLQCHGPDAAARKADLRLDSPDGWLADHDGATPVVPGAPGESELLARVRATGKRRMPPRDHGPALTEAQVDTLARWIAAGAPFEEHWAYAPFHAVAPPEVEDVAWVRNPIDRFVLARLEAEGEHPRPEADRRALIRRVTFDLTGLPPTPEAVAAFVADPAPDAYERVVDRLLGSHAYAERWTRAWMDLARYADSHGFTIDSARSMWPWRDWVLRAIDADMPYDEFTVRQLAGDLLPGHTNADVVATGFQRNTQVNQEGGAKDEENRVNAVHDRVQTTGAVWLGTTLLCARCHDHKFDPFTQRDYYRLFAFYDSTEDGGVTSGPSALVASTPEEERAVAAYEAGRAEAEAAYAAASDAAADGWRTWVPDRTEGENGPELVVALDGSVTSLGQNPVFSAYELEGTAPADGVTALRLEALPGRDLPAGGPGRARNGNFVVTAVRVAWQEGSDGDWHDVPLAAAAADLEQDTRAEGGGHYPAADVLDGDDASGWAVSPAFDRPHVLHLDLAEPVPGGAALRVVLEQKHGDNHVLGRFRLRTRADGPAPAPRVPPEWTAAWRAVEASARARPDLPTLLAMRERPVPRQSHVFVRGSFLDPGEPVEPGFPAALATLVPVEELGHPPGTRLDRLDLARWLVHPRNALVHRVTVNRWWQAFFGLGLVATENDFGLRGAAPSHPELLEWLAQDHVRNSFSRKHVHRLIVTSATYRQAAPAYDAEAAADPRNRRLARQRRLRLDAEEIRDAALAASGLLAERFGGPPVQPPQPDGVFAFTQSKKRWDADEGPDRYRRTLYTRLWRSSVYPFLTTFDTPQPTVACTRRLRSTSPLQALTLANDPMFLELAAGLGARARREGGDGPGGVRRIFALALGRAPSDAEEALLSQTLERERGRRTARGEDAESAAAGAWAALGRVVLNLDEFVTRP